MAKRSPLYSRSGSGQGSADDAFTARILEFIAWSRHNTQLLIALIVIGVVAVVGLVYYVNQRSAMHAEAAMELERIQATVLFEEPDAVIGNLREFVTTFRRTPFATEARLALAEVLLEEGRAGEAIETLSEVAPSFGDPLRLQATILLASAYESAEDWSGAAGVYRELSERAEFSFQRREAAEGLARVLLVEGDTAGAIEAYRAALGNLEEDSPQRGVLEMRLAELTAGDPARD